MTPLRSNINVKALGLHWRDGRLLASEVLNGRGQVVCVRPLGGTVQFGERSEMTLKREFREELCLEAELLSGPLVIANIYNFERERGHEIIFAFEVGFVPNDHFSGGRPSCELDIKGVCSCSGGQKPQRALDLEKIRRAVGDGSRPRNLGPRIPRGAPGVGRIGELDHHLEGPLWRRNDSRGQ